PTGEGIASLLLVTIRSRQDSLPDAGSSAVTDSCVQTINCLFPPAVTTIGELFVTDSASAFQTSLPDSLSRARTHAPGLPPMKRISSLPSIRGEGLQISS